MKPTLRHHGPPKRRPARFIAVMVAALASSCLTADDRLTDPYARCTEGRCECIDNFDDCDSIADNGCETDLHTSNTHCGGCGNDCANGECVAGECHCAPEFGDCDRDLANGCETDLWRDAAHCGDCGHDCRGGECLERTCHPFQLAGGLDYPRHLVITPTAAFWSAWTQLVMLPLDGSSGPVTLSTVPDEVRAVAIGGDRVCWTSSYAVRSMIPGDPSTTLTIGPGYDSTIDDLAADSQYAYWLEYGTVPSELRRARLDGSEPWETIVTEVYSGPLVSPSYVYWSPGPSPIWRTALDGSSSELFDPSGFSYGMAHDGYIYWADFGALIDIDIRRKPEAGGAAITLASRLEQVQSMAVANGGLYFTDSMAGVVYGLSLTGGTPTAIASGQLGAHYVQADEQFVYWLTDTSLMRLVR